ncbi:Flp pilus assembly protein CpaB [Zhongshania sp. BJYM1]|jgi:pilus assembly protein CpaB|uniref:Flp pilus assembly protein CpaB n=1 Tax=Zhongshania aquatica TaxID=2965069 RepID=UPI0022B5518A|nr:Flp pilus assembly protein CpaB [Marortus sp. BJYM1]
MQARTLKIIAALLIVSAVFMGIIGYKISQEDSSKSRSAQQAQASNTTDQTDFAYAQKLLIVNRGMNKGDIVTAEDVQLIPYPLLVEGSFTKVADIVNKKLESKVAVGAIIRESDFEKQSTLAPHISQGYRALAIKVNEASGAGGFLQPGDRVDVIFTTKASKETYNKSMSRRLLKNVRLLAFGTDVERDDKAIVVTDSKKKSKDEKESGKSSRSAVLEIALDDIGVLTLAEESGDLRLVALGEADMDLESTVTDESDADLNAVNHISDADKTAFIRDVTGLSPPPRPKSIYVYSGDSVETISVRN